MLKPPPRPHPLARSERVDQLCGLLEKAWQRGVATRPSLDPEVLWGKALADLPAEGAWWGRSAEDAEDFRSRLDALGHSLESEARLNSLGLTIAHGQLVRVIRQRLQLGQFWNERPEHLAADLAPPVIVVGQMRSGTTRVHRLLAADPNLSGTRFCDSWHPVPRKPDTRPAWSALSLMIARTIDPWLDSIHPFGTTRPDEELGWLAGALDHCAYEAQWRIPSFTGLSEARDPAPIYREFARILRTDASNRGNAHRPRVIKVPQFAEDLPALLAQFPGALVVRTHRCEIDLAKSAGSLVANQMTIQSDDVDMDWIEAEVARKIALRRGRMDNALRAYSGPIALVEFADLSEDWRGEIARIYDALGLQLSDATLAAMEREQARAEKGAHKQHSETYEGFAVVEDS